MRIIAGKLKGHRLVSFQASHLRPTLDRVKESIFNKWMAHWDGARVLDLFSGTGNLGFEAYSRGAQEVVMVENHPRSLDIIKKNKEKLKIIEKVFLVKQDVFSFLKHYNKEPFDIILVDPPFTQSLADSALLCLSQSAVFHKETLIMAESSPREKIQDQYGVIQLIQRKLENDKVVNFYHIE